MKSIVLHPYEVVALQQGRLKELRRPVEPQPQHRDNQEMDGGTLLVCDGEHDGDNCEYLPFATCPIGAPSTRIHVFEEWTTDLPHKCNTCGDEEGIGSCCLVGYGVDQAVHLVTVTIWPDPQEFTVSDFNDNPAWQPASEMPPAYSRYELGVEDVKVEQVQSLTECAAESCGCSETEDPSLSAVVVFAARWDFYYPEFLWASNPWCWVAKVWKSGASPSSCLKEFNDA